MSRILTIAIGFLLAASQAYAEKKITIQITHPPSLGAALAGRMVAPGQMTGDCSKEFADLLFADLRAHGLTKTGGADVSAPAIVLSINVSRCEGRPQQAILGEGLPAVHIARTDGWFAAQLQAVDPANGQEVASVAVQGHAQKENQSQTGEPEWPAPSELKALAMRKAIGEAQRLYTTWTENRDLPFMDGKECHMKQAYDLAKASDFQGVVRLLKGEVDSCNPGSKAGMEAWYDLGVAYMQLGRFDGAAAAFEKASALNGGKPAAELMAECQREVAAIQARQPKPAPPAQGPPVQTGMVMTNDLIVKLIQGNVAEDEVVKMIANQPAHFSLEPADLAQMKAAGVPESVITAMRNKK
ncbi:MAG: tetratricopeptide repeat protein [Bryobacteraceae bacterium]